MQVFPDLDQNNHSLQFKVAVGTHTVMAFVSLASLCARFGPQHHETGVLEMYLRNRAQVDEAVVRRLDAGARSPIVLRVADL